ncbi:MAG: PH domain-containing protein [Dehalococcoidia bacterium]|nr:PH domain-containing protein [Gammaproteobacteria bacterium]MYA54093.1 PH domain-containing protein [Dehalococcoidia bacterium]
MRPSGRASKSEKPNVPSHGWRDVDHPRPGASYLALLFGLAALWCLMCGLALPELRGAGRLEWIAASVVGFSVSGLIVATVDAAFRTRYEISGHELRLRSGFVITAVIRHSDVATVERVGFIPRVLGWGGGRGLANRLTDGLQITLHSGAVYYVSPTNPEAFSGHIRSVSADCGSG